MIILLMIRAWAWLLLDFRWAFNDIDFTFPNIVGGRVTSHHNSLKVVSSDDDKELELHYTIFVLSEVSGRMALKTKGFACLMIELCLQAFGNFYLAAYGGGPFMEWDLRPELKWFNNSLVCVKFME